MKRSHEPEPKRFDQMVAQIGALTSDEMLALAHTAKQFYREACSLTVAQIPEDVWCLVVAVWGKRLKYLCRMACVSRAWCHRITQHIRREMAGDMLLDARILFKFPEVQELTLTDCTGISDSELAQLTHLTGLSLRDDAEITTKGVKPLRHLRSLALVGRCPGLAGKAVRDHIHLTSLKLCGTNKHLGNGVFERLARLTSLDLCNNEHVTDKPLCGLWGLRSLGLAGNKKITDAGISHMRALTSLNLRDNGNITDAALRHLTQLTELNLSRNTGIVYGTTLVPLAANLQRLWLAENRLIDPVAVAELTQLRHLCLHNDTQIPGWVLPRLTNLETLVMGSYTQFMTSQLTAMVNLRHLVLPSGNLLSTHQMESLALMPNLTRLSLTCRFSDALKPLKEARPNMKMDYISVCSVQSKWQGSF